ncbi:MAG: tetratricopeptide repeat protein [Acidobacteria bacterium]|nr:tetratricopeptide repeat protein [Acidobacteriota bacterium]
MHISSNKLGFIGVCFIALMLELPAAAQTRIFRGKVTDEKNQPIKGATVIIQGIDVKSRTYNAKTDKKGTWVYMGLPEGFYHVAARAPGFVPAYQTQIRAAIDETEINLQLKPGEDQKLPFEMTAEELRRLEQEAERAKKRQEASAEVQALFDEGTRLAEAGSHAEAIEKFKQALEKDPDQPNILGNMAESYRKIDKNNEALEAYQKAIALEPDNAVFYTNLGVVLDKLGKSTESQEAFTKAASLNPGGSAQSYFNLGATLVNSGRSEEAIEPFRKAIAADPNFGDAYFELGMCLSAKPETMEEAIRHLKKYIEIGNKPEQKETAKAIIDALEQSLKKK